MKSKNINSDATPAYRGYRLQALYILSRILECENDSEFQPEGMEDLSIFIGDKILEIVQVKAYSEPLKFSDLKNFFSRMKNYIQEYPSTKVIIASYGPIGTELTGAVATTERNKQKIIEKMKGLGIEENIANKIIDNLEFHPIIEDDLNKKIKISINYSIAGINNQRSIEMLYWWVYICSENKTIITKQTIISKLNQIGEFLSQRESYHKEWFKTIRPIEDQNIDPAKIEKMQEQYYNGFSAKYYHIQSNFDIVRIDKLKTIHRAFKNDSIIIMHGASGQGKTTLAYRYAHDYYPEKLKFQIIAPDSQSRILEIINAVKGYVNTLNFPALIYLDVNPGDLNWYSIAKEFQNLDNIKLLITIREEDFQRTNISQHELDAYLLDLEFDKKEAFEIYDSFNQKQLIRNLISFDEAWHKFGDKGPLLEFVHLITQGSLLEERLKQQIALIQNYVNESKHGYCKESLRLLKLVVIASAFDVKLKLKPLLSQIDLAIPERTIDLLQKEYLLTVSEDSNYFIGLHQIRSKILSEILFDDCISPWIDHAKDVLPFIADEDFEIFLLSSFSRKYELSDQLFDSVVELNTNNWCAMKGIIRALIWLGVKRYIDENKEIIKILIDRFQDAWFLWFDADFWEDEFSKDFNIFDFITSKMDDEILNKLKLYRENQTDKANIFKFLKIHIRSKQYKMENPVRDYEYKSFGESLFWIGKLGLSSNIQFNFSSNEQKSIISNLPLDIVGQIIFGYYYYDNSSCPFDQYKNIIKNRFAKETNSVALNFGKDFIHCHYIFDILNQSEQKDKELNIYNYKSMKRLHLLSNLFLYYQEYRINGYGHMGLISDDFHDESIKRINKHLLLPDFYHMPQRLLVGIVEYEFFRPDNWNKYTEKIIEIREAIIDFNKLLQKELSIYFRKKKPYDNLLQIEKSVEFQKVTKILKHFPKLPKCAVDEWGFIRDSNTNDKDESKHDKTIEQETFAMRKYRDYLKSLSRYKSLYENYINSFGYILGSNFAIGRKFKSINNKQNITKIKEIKDLVQKINVCENNFAESIKYIALFQKEFNNLFLEHQNESELHNIAIEEKQIFEKLWITWYNFSFSPKKQIPKPELLYLSKTKKYLTLNKYFSKIMKNVRRKLNKLSVDTMEIQLLSEEYLYKSQPALWVTVNTDNINSCITGIDTIYDKLVEIFLSQDHDRILRHLLDMKIQNVLILPLINHKSFGKKAFVFQYFSFTKDHHHQFKEYNLFPYELSTQDLRHFNLNVWDDDNYKIPMTIYENYSAANIFFKHLSDFQRILQLEDLEDDIFSLYLQKLAFEISKHLQKTVDFLEKGIQYFNTNLDELIKINKEVSVQILKNIIFLVEYIDQCPKQRNDIEEIITWAKSFPNYQDHVNQILFNWHELY